MCLWEDAHPVSAGSWGGLTEDLVELRVWTLIMFASVAFAGQGANSQMGGALLAILSLVGAANFWYFGKLTYAFQDTDRKMDW